MKHNLLDRPIAGERVVFVQLALWVALVAFALIPTLAAAESSATNTSEAEAGMQAEDSASAEDSAPATTEENEADEPVSFFEQTTVTATGTEIDTFQIPTPVIVINEERIQELQPNSATDLLRDEPGVDVNGVGPNQGRPIIRGNRGLRVLFLQNGLRMNNARRQTDFGEIVGMVDMEFVERMEVVRGAASVLYGTDAIGGVLNLITRVPAPGAGTGFQGTIGYRYSDTDSQSKGSAGISGFANNFSYELSGTLRDADDYEVPAGTFGDITLDEETVVHDTAIEDDSLNAYAGYRLNERHALFGRWSRYRAEQTGFGFVDPALLGESDLVRIIYPFQDFDRYTIGYSTAGIQSPGADSFDIQAYYQDNERELANEIFIDIGAPFGLPSDLNIDTLNFTDVETFGFRAEVRKLLGDKHLLTYGGEYFNDDSFNTDDSLTVTTLRAPFPIDFICGPSGAIPFPFECVFEDADDVANTPNAENIGSGLFIQDTWMATDKFTAIFGARYARSETNAKETPGLDVSGLDFSDDAVVGALNLTYAIKPVFNLVGSVGTAFRAPNIVERLFNGPTPEGIGFQILNPALESEKSLNWDFGFKFRNQNAFFEATYFNNEIDDAIVQVTLSEDEIAMLPPDVQDEIESSGSSVVVQQRNAEKLTIEGFEVAGGYSWVSGFSLGANYSHQSGQSDLGSEASDPTGDTYSDKVAGYFRYAQPKGRWWAEYRIRHNGEQDQILDPDQDPGPIGDVLPAFTTHAVGGGVTVYESARWSHQLGLGVENLTDELYAEFSNASFFRPQPGRTIIANYRLRVR